MQILSGRYKGLRIKTKSSGPYRPTSARVRKSIFDILGDLSGFNVLDLFAGSGILGFESASRGAAKITFVEKHNLAIMMLRENAELFKDLQVAIVKTDAFKFIMKDVKYDLIFADPPYVISNIFELVQGSIKLLKHGGIFILESTLRDFPISPSRIKTYGNTQVSFWNGKA